MTDVHPGIARNSRSKNNTSIAIGRFGNLRLEKIYMKCAQIQIKVFGR